jgi:hypothetical protein
MELRLVAVPLRSATVSAAEVSAHHRPGFIDGQYPAVELRAVQGGDGLIGAFFRHGDESEAFGASGVPLGDDADRFHSSTLLERARDIAFRRLKRQISNK